MLDPSNPPSWLRPASVRWADASSEYFSLSARRLAGYRPPPHQPPHWSQTWSDVVHSHRTLEALKRAGITSITLHFDGGFGARAQAGEFRQAARFAQTCHEYGLRVFTRIEAGALYYESLLGDRPGLAAWAQRDPRGEIRWAEDGQPAWRPCYRSRGYLEMLKDSISLACEQCDADGVQLANFGPHECYCERCQHAFRALVMSQCRDPHTLGLPSLDHVRIPPRPTWADPIYPYAIRFGLHVLRSALSELRIHLRSISAHVLLWGEPLLAVGNRHASCSALWELAAPLDIITSRVADDGTDQAASLRALAHAFVAGRGARTTVCARPRNGCRSDQQVQADMGAALAFGGHVLACHGGLAPPGGPHATSAPVAPRLAADSPWEACLDFAARHEHYHHQSESLAELALLFSAADSMADEADVEAFRATESALLEGHIPFDILPIGQADPRRHAVFVLAGQTYATDEERERLSKLAHDGAKLVLLGQAASLSPAGGARGGDTPRVAGARPSVTQLPAADGCDGEGVTQLSEALKAHLPDPPVVALRGCPETPGGAVVAPFRLPTGQATFHLLNVGGALLDGIRLQIREDLAPTRHIAWHEPGATDRMLDCAVEGGSVVTALPPLGTYALVVTS